MVLGSIMEEFDFSRIFQSIVPSLFQLIPSPSKEVLQSLYLSYIIQFTLKATRNTPKNSEVVDFSKYYLSNFEFQMLHRSSHETTIQFFKISSLLNFTFLSMFLWHISLFFWLFYRMIFPKSYGLSFLKIFHYSIVLERIGTLQHLATQEVATLY